MEEKRNYVVYTNDCFGMEEQEHVIKMSKAQADAIRWFINIHNINGCVELAENYEGEEI